VFKVLSISATKKGVPNRSLRDTAGHRTTRRICRARETALERTVGIRPRRAVSVLWCAVAVSTRAKDPRSGFGGVAEHFHW